LVKPVSWKFNSDPPLILLRFSRRFRSSPGTGDRFLARLLKLDDATYEAQIIRPLENKPKTITGIFSYGNRIQSVTRGKNNYYNVAPRNTLNAKLGELVVAKLLPFQKHEVPKAEVLKLLGKPNKTSTFSQIAIHLHDIPYKFSNEVLEQAAACQLATCQNRTD